MTKEQLEVATFAGGCFWCMVEPFESQQGIKTVVSGYTGVTLKIQHTSKYVHIQQGIQKRSK